MHDAWMIFYKNNLHDHGFPSYVTIYPIEFQCEIHSSVDMIHTGKLEKQIFEIENIHHIWIRYDIIYRLLVYVYLHITYSRYEGKLNCPKDSPELFFQGHGCFE